MAKETYGYTAPQYFYWQILADGSKRIYNGSQNYVVKKYKDGGWDYQRVYSSDGSWE